MRGVGGATGLGADVDHVRELSLGSLVGSCGRVLEVDSGERPWFVSDDEWRELLVERVSDEIIDRIEGLAALRATLRPRCATRGRPLVPGRKSGVGRSRIASPGKEASRSS